MNTNRIDKRCWIAIVALGAVVVAGATVTHAQAPPPPQHAEIQAGPHGWSAWMGGGVGSRIGVSIRDVERAEQDDGLTEGVVVADVLEEGPARTAGMETGDVVVEFDGERIRSARQLSRMVADTPAGRAVTVEVVRHGERVSLEVTPESGTAWFGRHARRLGRNFTAAIPNGLDFKDFHFGARRARLGVEVIELGPQLANYFGVETGLLVTAVRDGTAAAEAGLRAGDVVTTVDGHDVAAEGDLRRRVAGIEPGDVFSIDVVRDGVAVSVEVRLDSPPPQPRRPA